MSETVRLSLPLLMPSQAQKHVTVNEALSRLDGLVQLVLASRSIAAPPPGAEEGAAYAVPDGAVGAWSGQDGKVAILLNGGWVFVAPGPGWRAFIEDEWRPALHDGQGWVGSAHAVSRGGAGIGLDVREVDHPVTGGPVSIVEGAIPDGVVVFGVTGRVLETIGGSASSLSIGVSGAADRYGAGIGLVQGAWMRGITGMPLAYYGETDLTVTAEGGTFGGGGVIRLAVHFVRLELPRPA